MSNSNFYLKTEEYEKARAHKRLSNAQIARKADLTPRHISRLRTENQGTTYDTLTRLAEALGVHIDTISTDQKPESANKTFSDTVLTLDWRELQDKHNPKLRKTQEGDHIIGICVNPEAFKPIQQTIEDAAHRGVKVTLVYLDTTMIDSKAGWEYINSLAIANINIVTEGTQFSSRDFQNISDKIKAESGERNFLLSSSALPHQFIGLLCFKELEKSSWAIVAPYIPYKQDMDSPTPMRDWGMFLTENNPLYERYKSAIAILASNRMIEKGETLEENGDEEADYYIKRGLDISKNVLGENHSHYSKLRNHSKNPNCL